MPTPDGPTARPLTIAGVASAAPERGATVRVTNTSIADGRGRARGVCAAGMKMAASRGVASVQKAGTELGTGPVPGDALRDSGDLTLRVRLAFDMTPNGTRSMGAAARHI